MDKKVFIPHGFEREKIDGPHLKVTAKKAKWKITSTALLLGLFETTQQSPLIAFKVGDCDGDLILQ